MRTYSIKFNESLKKKYGLDDAKVEGRLSSEAIEEYFKALGIKYSATESDNFNTIVTNLGNGKRHNYAVSILSSKGDTYEEIELFGKKYKKKRYSAEELRKEFDGKIVFLVDATIDFGDIQDGILVDACEPEDKNSGILRNLGKDNTLTLLDNRPFDDISIGGSSFVV